MQGLTCKWINAQKPRLMGYKSLIKTALGLGLVRLNLGWIGQDKFSLNNKKVIVITVHLNTQKYSKAENSQRNQSISLCNDSVIVTMIYEMYNDSMNRYNVSAQLIQLLFFLNCYNDSQTVITVQAENSFFSYFRRSILKWSSLSLKNEDVQDLSSKIITPESLLVIYIVREIIQEIETLN
jgi:hypothetical protein